MRHLNLLPGFSIKLLGFRVTIKIHLNLCFYSYWTISFIANKIILAVFIFILNSNLKCLFMEFCYLLFLVSFRLRFFFAVFSSIIMLLVN